jgi:AraC-like DNA-binding protein
MIAYESLGQSDFVATRTTEVEKRIALVPRHVVTNSLATLSSDDAILPTEVGYRVIARGQQKQSLEGLPHALFIYCTAGHGYCTFQDQRLKVGAGDLLVIPAGLAHEYGASEVDPWSFYWVGTEGTLTDKFLRASNISGSAAIRQMGHDLGLIGLFVELTEILHEGHHTENLFHASNVLRHLMSVLVRRQRESQNPSICANQRVTASIAFMMRNLSQPLDVRLLSQTAKLSPSHYSALFKRQTGYSPVDYFMRLRMQSATELLENTNLSVKAVATKLGYKDPLYFSRVFASIYQISPSEYRKRKREGNPCPPTEPSSNEDTSNFQSVQ